MTKKSFKTIVILALMVTLALAAGLIAVGSLKNSKADESADSKTTEELSLSNNTFIDQDKKMATTKIFSTLSSNSVSRLWDDIYYLENKTEIRNVSLIIFSGGGDLFSGLALADIIEQARKRGFKFTAIAYGMIASAAVPVLAVCDRRITAPDTIFMVHESSIYKDRVVRENTSEIVSQGELLVMARERYNGKLAIYSHLKIEDWLNLESKTTYFTAEKAQQWGLVDAIE